MSTRSVEIYEGNTTLRGLMASALSRAGVRVVERFDDTEPTVELADMLVVDVDSGLPEIDALVHLYEAEDIPVLFCGVRNSRDRFPDVVWIDRPFSRVSFLTQCLQLLRVEEDPSAITMTGEEEPITRELLYDEAMQLEEQLGLESGALGPPGFEDDDDDVLDIDEHGSVIIEVSDLESVSASGRLVGAITKRRYEESEIAEDRARDIAPLRTRSPTFNQTMPETPLAIAGESEIEETPEVLPEPTIVPPPPSDGPTGEMAPLVKSVARMLAESWDRIALAARTEDRADRIERVLKALMGQGVRGASSELRRIPTSVGFAGSLEALTVIEIMRTIRDRKLRGRLEVSVVDGTFVVFLDGPHVEDIENLSGSGDLVLLDVLHAIGFLDEDLHTELAQGYATGSFHQPAEMKLLNERIVTPEQLLTARTVRMKDAFRKICSVRRGTFSFLDVRPGDGQPWPVNGLRQAVDQLLLEILREASIDTGDSQATARTKLVMDPTRAASLDPDALTPDELSILKFFRDGKKLGEALEQFDGEDIDRVINRLKQIELLKRSDPSISIPAGLNGLQGPEHTVVSSRSNQISASERQRTPESEVITSLTDPFDIGPDTDNIDSAEVDALIDEALGDDGLSSDSESEVEDP